MAGCRIPRRRPLRRLAKVGVEGSNPFARSNFRQWLKDDAQPRRLLSIVVYERNGNRGYNLHMHAAASINCLAEMLRHRLMS
jgi:hypothetical protein